MFIRDHSCSRREGKKFCPIKSTFPPVGTEANFSHSGGGGLFLPFVSNVRCEHTPFFWEECSLHFSRVHHQLVNALDIFFLGCRKKEPTSRSPLQSQELSMRAVSAGEKWFIQYSSCFQFVVPLTRTGDCRLKYPRI